MTNVSKRLIFIKHNINPNLNIPPNDQHFKLNKINEIKDYLVAEIKERELMSKRLSKYIASFDYFHKSLIVLSVATSSISIASFVIVIGVPVGTTNASLSLAFSICTGIVKHLLKKQEAKTKSTIKSLC